MSDFCLVYLPFTRTDGYLNPPVVIRFPDADSKHTSYELFEALKDFIGFKVEYWQVVPSVGISGYALLVDEEGLFNPDWTGNVWASALYQRRIVGPVFVLVENSPELDFLRISDSERLFRWFKRYLLLPDDYSFSDWQYSSFSLPKN